MRAIQQIAELTRLSIVIANLRQRCPRPVTFSLGQVLFASFIPVALTSCPRTGVKMVALCALILEPLPNIG